MPSAKIEALIRAIDKGIKKDYDKVLKSVNKEVRSEYNQFIKKGAVTPLIQKKYDKILLLSKCYNNANSFYLLYNNCYFTINSLFIFCEFKI